MKKILFLLLGFFLLSAVPATYTSAHEVYVLNDETVRTALAADSPNPLSAYFGNEYEFLLWGLISFIVLSTIFFATIFHFLERQASPFLSYVKRFAHPIARVTVGACLIGFGLSARLFGTEISFSELFGPASGTMQMVFVGIGIACIVGLYVRYIALLMIGIYTYAVLVLGSYVLTYTDHLGAYLLLFSLGSGLWSLDRLLRIGDLPALLQKLGRGIAPYAFPIMRVLFGFGVMFAAVYAKFIHSELALQTVVQHHLTDYFPFDPLFIVLGALIIEFLCGLMIFLGIAIRWTGLFLMFWLTLSQLYFHELWWVHVVLFGIGLAIFCHGYDRFSLEGRFFKKGEREPIL